MAAAKSFERMDVENFGSRKAKAAATNTAAQLVAAQTSNAAEIIYMKTSAVVEVAKAVAERAVVEDEEILERWCAEFDDSCKGRRTILDG
ncbi:MAG: hypothetical protein Q9205_006833, partial [Flavoplaca limonia]